jgi:hypothetical protein
MTTFLFIEREPTTRLFDYLNHRKEVLVKDILDDEGTEWMKRNLLEICWELVKRGEMTSCDFRENIKFGVVA